MMEFAGSPTALFIMKRSVKFVRKVSLKYWADALKKIPKKYAQSAPETFTWPRLVNASQDSPAAPATTSSSARHASPACIWVALTNACPGSPDAFTEMVFAKNALPLSKEVSKIGAWLKDVVSWQKQGVYLADSLIYWLKLEYAVWRIAWKFRRGGAWRASKGTASATKDSATQ